MKPYYEHGGITIYHGDCREILPSLSCDLVLADPPYGIGIHRSSRGMSAAPVKGAKPDAHKWQPIAGDNEPFNPSALLRFPKLILWGGNHYADRLPAQPSWFVWDKREGTTSDAWSDAELAWTNLGGPARLYRHLWRGLVCRGEENGKRRFHQAQKPVALMRWCIEQAKLALNSLIVDPYTGSGTTLVAAYRLGHRAIGIEIEERYCEIAAKRLAQEVLPLEQAV